MNDEARAFLIVGALIASVSGSGGFVGGRVTAPVPPAEVRYVTVPVPVAPLADAAPIEPPAPAVVEPAPAPQVEPPVTTAPPPIETKPVLPAPRPKVEAASKPKPAAQSKPRAPALKKSLPSCAVVQQKYNAMSVAERWSEYRRATPEEVAHGRRCLGF